MPRTDPGRRLALLALVNGELGERVSGPAIRSWQLARALAERFEVTVAVRRPPAGERDGIRLVTASRRTLLREARRHDAILAACVPPYLLAAKALRPTLVVSDQYDPVDLELGTLDSAREVESGRAVRRLELGFADLVLCAGPRQGRRLLDELDMIPRVPAGRPRLLEVPFGLPPDPPPARGRPLRERFPQIAADDTVVLWWGSVWRWLDAETAIRAVAPLTGTRHELKLVITSGPAPEAERKRFDESARARELARSLGVLDRTVLFLEDWVPYAERHEWLADADLGVSLHRDTPEAALAARARYMDYLWSELPCVLTRGDEVAARFAEGGFARLVKPGDAGAVRDELLALADDPSARAAARMAARPLADSYRWEQLARPLGDALATLRPAPRLGSGDRARLALEAGAYYLRRARDELVPEPPRVLSRSRG